MDYPFSLRVGTYRMRYLGFRHALWLHDRHGIELGFLERHDVFSKRKLRHLRLIHHTR
jgi:hypothetical protein